MKRIHPAAAILFALFCFVGGFLIGRVPAPATEPVLVAAEDLPFGTLLNDPPSQLKKVGFLRETVPPGAVSNPEELRNKVLGRAIPKNTPVTLQDLSMPPGMRAMTFKTILEGSGFLLPGSRIDLIFEGPDLDDPKKSVRKTFVEDLLVLAVNSASRPDYTTEVTVAVSPAEAEQIAAAQNRGRLMVTLHQPRKPAPSTVANPFDDRH
jgi:Flp pilus assembly protein CpaB